MKTEASSTTLQKKECWAQMYKSGLHEGDESETSTTLKSVKR